LSAAAPERGGRRAPGRRFELTIASLAAGGDGVGRAPDGRVVFVPFTAPGDRVRVRVVAEERRLVRARVETLLAPGAARTDPVCPVFGSCGGCAWQHVDYGAQLEAKRAIVEAALARIGGVAAPGPLTVTPSPEAYGYRGRARVQVRGGSVGFRRRRSHALCATSRCPILLPALEQALAELASRPPAGNGEWELAAGSDGVVHCAPLGARPAAADATAGEAARVRLTSAGETARVRLVAAGERVGRSAGVFAQANALLLDRLAAAVLGAAGAGRAALELFSGAGFFTLGLARRFGRVDAVEGDPAAVADLRRNLEEAGVGNVHVHEAAVERGLDALATAGIRPQVVVLDPPRTGLPREAPARIAALRPPRLVYLSCDPATLARDVAVLAGERYRLAHVEAFDLFPQTPHVEALAVLERRPEATAG